MQLQSEQIDKISQAINEVQADLIPLKKNKTAKFVSKRTGQTIKYDYIDLQSCLDAVKTPFKEKGLALVQGPIFFEGKTFMSSQLSHITGQWMIRIYPIEIPNAQSFAEVQDTQKVLTALRRYLLCSMIGICPDDDDDAILASHGVQSATAARSGSGVFKNHTDIPEKDIERMQPHVQLYVKCQGENIPAKDFWDYFELSREDPNKTLNVINNFEEYKTRFGAEK